MTAKSHDYHNVLFTAVHFLFWLDSLVLACCYSAFGAAGPLQVAGIPPRFTSNSVHFKPFLLGKAANCTAVCRQQREGPSQTNWVWAAAHGLQSPDGLSHLRGTAS